MDATKNNANVGGSEVYIRPANGWLMLFVTLIPNSFHRAWSSRRRWREVYRVRCSNRHCRSKSRWCKP